MLTPELLAEYQAIVDDFEKNDDPSKHIVYDTYRDFLIALHGEDNVDEIISTFDDTKEGMEKFCKLVDKL